MATWAARQTPAESKAKYAARDVCLEQDAAGRLLESMGDHARREMIVRVTKVARQNPAYRPFANNRATSDGTLSEVARFSKQPAVMKSNDDAPKNGWLPSPRVPLGCLYSFHSAAAGPADTIALITKSRTDITSNSSVDLQLRTRCNCLRDIQDCRDRESVRFGFAPGDLHKHHTRVAHTRAGRRHDSFHRHHRHIFNNNSRCDWSRTVRSSPCATLGIILR